LKRAEEFVLRLFYRFCCKSLKSCVQQWQKRVALRRIREAARRKAERERKAAELAVRMAKGEEIDEEELEEIEPTDQELRDEENSVLQEMMQEVQEEVEEEIALGEVVEFDEEVEEKRRKKEEEKRKLEEEKKRKKEEKNNTKKKADAAAAARLAALELEKQRKARREVQSILSCILFSAHHSQPVINRTIHHRIWSNRKSLRMPRPSGKGRRSRLLRMRRLRPSWPSSRSATRHAPNGGGDTCCRCCG